MHIRCGQCGHMFGLERPAVSRKTPCPRCGHDIFLADLSAGTDDSSGRVETCFEGQDEPEYAALAEQSMSQKTRFVCGKCGRGLRVETRFAGKRVRCPNCKERIRVPYPDAEAEFELAALKTDVEELEVLEEPQVEVSAEPVQAPLDAAEVLAADALAPIERRYSHRWAIVAVAVCVLWIAALGYWLYRGRRDSSGPPDVSVVATAPVTSSAVSQPTSDESVAPPTQPATQVGHPEAPAAATIVGSQMFVLPPSGYCPAGPQKVYLKLSVELLAGDRPLRFSSAGRDVTFTSRGKTYRSLGLAAGAEAVGAAGLSREVELAPGSGATFDFLFEAPIETFAGTLRISGVPKAESGALFPPKAPDAQMLVGAWSESPPRSLKPLLRDPVMAAVQNNRNLRLIVEWTGAGLRVSLPGLDIAGVPEHRGYGHFAVQFRKGENTLDCTLRLIEAGGKLVLYLADEPFHQVVFARRAEPTTTQSAP